MAPSINAPAAGATPQLKEARYSQSLERGLAILTCFTAAEPVLGIADLADTLGMSRSTTHRYVVTLVELGYLEQDARRKYRLGSRVTDLGISAIQGSGWPDQAAHHLEWLRRETGYASGVATLHPGGKVLYVAWRRSQRTDQRTEPELQVGSQAPVYATAAGKLLLAYLPPTVQSEVLGELEIPRTGSGPNQVSTKKALRQDLTYAQARGCAMTDQELMVGVHQIAAPIWSAAGEAVAAAEITVCADATLSPWLTQKLRARVETVASNLSASLGYRYDQSN